MKDIFKECPECGGAGTVEHTYAVVDHDNGGYLAAKEITCELCNGLGEVMFDELEEEEE